MKALLQRVSRASVRVDGRVVGEIGPGLVVLLGVARGDTEQDARYLAERTASLRIFPDEAGRFNRSLLEVGGAALVVSQFTLLADTRKGRRPSFVEASPPEQAAPLVDCYVAALREAGLAVKTGRFQAHMLVEIHNDGPVTVLLESKGGRKGHEPTPAEGGAP